MGKGITCPECKIKLHELDDTNIIYFNEDRVEFCRTCGSEIEECFTNFVPSYFPDTIENLLDISSKKELKRKLELIVKYGPRYEMTENVIIAKKLLSELTTSKE